MSNPYWPGQSFPVKVENGSGDTALRLGAVYDDGTLRIYNESNGYGDSDLFPAHKLPGECAMAIWPTDKDSRRAWFAVGRHFAMDDETIERIIDETETAPIAIVDAESLTTYEAANGPIPLFGDKA